MKKTFAILTILLAIVFQGFAQDTITGVVNRVAAPYFEQNVCDSRFALSTGSETYYVMIDNYWPNPYLEDLVIHYDTIPVGNEVEVVGTIKEMEDGNGERFSVINIQKLCNAENDYFYSYLGWIGGFRPIAFQSPDPINAYAIYHNGSPCFFAIDDNLQTDYYTWVVNGVSLDINKQHLFVGSYETWTDYYGEPFCVFNLKAAIPCDNVTDMVEGVITLDDDLCLTTPCGGNVCLSLFDGTRHHYLTIKGTLLHDNINTDLYGGSTPFSVSGTETRHYDLFGDAYYSVEIVVIQSLEEKTMLGVLRDAAMPAVGLVPVPGVTMAFYSDNYFYYIENPILHTSDLYAVVIGSDTISCCGTELTATFTSTMKVDNQFDPYYEILLSKTTITTGLKDSSSNETLIYPNPSNGIIKIISEQQLIEKVSVNDYMGCELLNRSCNSKQVSLDLKDFKGLAIIQIVFENGQTASRKVVIQ